MGIFGGIFNTSPFGTGFKSTRRHGPPVVQASGMKNKKFSPFHRITNNGRYLVGGRRWGIGLVPLCAGEVVCMRHVSLGHNGFEEGPHSIGQTNGPCLGSLQIDW
jgi:hypothetical protein